MEITLSRSGKRPLAFTGHLLATSDGRTAEGATSSRWWRIDIYQTDAGSYVLWLIWESQWQGEAATHYEAQTFTALAALAEALEAQDPLAYLVGFPTPRTDNHPYVERQRRLEQALTARWQAQVTEIMTALGLVERLEGSADG